MKGKEGGTSWSMKQTRKSFAITNREKRGWGGEGSRMGEKKRIKIAFGKLPEEEGQEGASTTQFNQPDPYHSQEREKTRGFEAGAEKVKNGVWLVWIGTEPWEGRKSKPTLQSTRGNRRWGKKKEERKSIPKGVKKKHGGGDPEKRPLGEKKKTGRKKKEGGGWGGLQYGSQKPKTFRGGQKMEKQG